MQKKSAGKPASHSGERQFQSDKKTGAGYKGTGKFNRKSEDGASGERSTPYRSKAGGEKKSWDKKEGGFGDRTDRKPYRSREEGSEGGERKPGRSFGDKPARPYRSREEGSEGGDRKPGRSFGDKPARPYRSREEGSEGGDRKPGRSFGDKPARSSRPSKRSDDAGDDSRPARKPAAGKGFPGMPDRKKSKEDYKRENRYTEREEFELAVQHNDKEYFGDDDDWEVEGDKRPKIARAAEYPMPLNKYIAHSGECGRREAAELVKQGKAKVNGELILDPGHKVNEGDQVTLSGKKLKPQKGLVYILLNKPKGFITTNEDDRGRKTVLDLVANADVGRVFPVGRLDRATTGLLLITNDGDLTQKLAHPSYEMKKVYHATLDKPLTKADFDTIMEGVELEDGKAIVDEMAWLEAKNELGLEIHSGKNRIVRRIFESLGYVVEKLDRVVYAGLTKKNLPRGKWRFLNEQEVITLKHFKAGKKS
jgi:23S rRNA pseudouridine2605 synthase